MSGVETPLGTGQRTDRLQAAVADYVARHNGRVTFQSDDRVVVVTGRPVNNVLHLILTLVTGLWVFVWIVSAITGGETSHVATVDDQGVVLIESMRTVNTGKVRLPAYRRCGAGFRGAAALPARGARRTVPGGLLGPLGRWPGTVHGRRQAVGRRQVGDGCKATVRVPAHI